MLHSLLCLGREELQRDPYLIRGLVGDEEGGVAVEGEFHPEVFLETPTAVVRLSRWWTHLLR
jgi:hypothetical protein